MSTKGLQSKHKKGPLLARECKEETNETKHDNSKSPPNLNLYHCARWLISMKKYEQAKKLLQKAASMNKVSHQKTFF